MSLTQKINIWLQGFIYCALLASLAGNVAMFQGYLIDKSKLQVTVCTAVAEAVEQAAEDNELMDAIERKTK